jgi:CBS domain-containing protein
VIRTAHPEDRLADVAMRRARGPAESILVFDDDDRLVGIVTRAGIERARAAASTPASTAT